MVNKTPPKWLIDMPKAELHLHIEGTFEPELMFEIAKRNDIQIPFKSIEEIQKAYNFDCLQDFLDIYYQGAGVLIYEKDFYDLTYSYLEKCAKQNVLHTEIMFDPQTHTERGINFETVINGISKACDDAKINLGVSSFLIMSYLRHLTEESAFKTLEQSLPFKDKIKAIGLDSSEKGNPPSKFKHVFRASVKEGYIPLAHAGEEGPPAYIYEALDLLDVHRIDHGNRALEDPALVQRLVDTQMPLTVCPQSNLRLAVVKDMAEHPIREMLAVGLKACINSDDPAYFGGYMNENFYALIDATGLNRDEIFQLTINGFESSFLSPSEKQIHLDRIHAMR